MAMAQAASTDMHCGHCGCNYLIPIYRSTARGRVRIDGLFRCDYCGKAHRVIAWKPKEEKPEAESNPTGLDKKRCPECGSTDLKVTSTRAQFRWRKCLCCNHNFKTPRVYI